MGQEEQRRTSRTVSESVVETTRIVRPNYLNGAGRLFGGNLMQWMDETAGIVARRHSCGNITTVSVDSLRFLKGAYQDDTVVIIGKMTYVGKTSMEVRVDAYVENLSGVRRPITRAYFTLVALDENERPVVVPGLITESAEQEMEWEAGKRRRENRIMRREEGF